MEFVLPSRKKANTGGGRGVSFVKHLQQNEEDSLLSPPFENERENRNGEEREREFPYRATMDQLHKRFFFWKKEGKNHTRW